MAARHNSELIDSLYQETNSEKAADIADEMKEIGDPYFILPLYAAYRRFKRDTRSHYFLIDLMGFKQPEAIEILKRIVTKELLGSADIAFLVDFCIENEYFPEEFTQQVSSLFDFELGCEIDGYDLAPHLRYFLAAKKFNEIEGAIVSVFEKDEFNHSAREVALKYLLKYDAKKYLQYYYDNYDKIENTKAEKIFAKELNGWKGGIVSKLKEKVMKEGSERAREIIEEKLKKDKAFEEKKEGEKEKNTDRKFSNADIITDIMNIREKINILTTGDVKFGFSLFLPAESLFKQAAVVEDEYKLTGCCMELRTIIQGINEKVSQHGILSEDAQKYIPGFSQEGSINNLHLFMISRGIKVDNELFGIRKINKVLAKLAHPSEEKEELIKQLQLNGLYSLYKNSDWNGLHKRLLTMYKNSLSLLYEAVSRVGSV